MTAIRPIEASTPRSAKSAIRRLRPVCEGFLRRPFATTNQRHFRIKPAHTVTSNDRRDRKHAPLPLSDARPGEATAGRRLSPCNTAASSEDAKAPPQVSHPRPSRDHPGPSQGPPARLPHFEFRRRSSRAPAKANCSRTDVGRRHFAIAIQRRGPEAGDNFFPQPGGGVS
jgi:hypothetical protein